MWRNACQWAVSLVLLCAFLLPIVAGIAGTVLPAFGWLPSGAAPDVGGVPDVGAVPGPGIDAWRGFNDVLTDPRAWPSLRLTLMTGVPATVLSLLLAGVVLAGLHGTRAWRAVLAWLPPLLAIPHAALAVGLLFLLSPSGWLVRLVSPALTGWTRPPDLWVIPDAVGASLVIGLVLKETPFLLLLMIAQLRHLDVDATLAIGRTLGYSRGQCWWHLVLPRLYPRIRRALLIVLAFNLTVVDMALLLGPGHPPTVSALLLSLLAEQGSRAAASAGALLLALLVALAFLGTGVLERGLGRITRRHRRRGQRYASGLPAVASHRGRVSLDGSRVIGYLGMALLAVPSLLALLVLPLWSLASRWRFPDPLPMAWTVSHWLSHAGSLWQHAMNTLWLALATAALSLTGAVFWLEQERLGRVPRIDAAWYLPLMLPQLTLLFGWQAATLYAGVEGRWATLLHGHWVYAMPYVVLSLGSAWRELDPRWQQSAALLGAGYWRQLLRIRLPLLAQPLAQAMAVAVAVSVAQYLPTLLLGAGRYATLTTELVTSLGGVDRRVIAALALLQALLPLLAFSLSLGAARRDASGRGRE